ncbi:unnamed protein product [Leuciscus chuanchicus]
MMQQQQSMTKFLAKNVPLKTKQAVTEKCVYMCAKDIRPFYFVQGDGFLELAQELINVGATRGRVAASSVLPSPNTVATHCRNLAEEKREELAKQVKEILNKGGKVGMSTDMWTDDFRKIHYLSITCHYVTEDFELIGKNLTTATFPVDEKKTGDNIKRELVKLLVTKFGFDPLSLKDIVWVTDQGANVVNALRSYTRLDCMDHVLNTVLRHGLDNDALMQVAPDFAETVTASKTLVRYVKQSGMTAQLSKTILQMVDTRFSTVYLTLKSISDIYAELQDKLEARGESDRIEKITPDTLGMLVSFLKPFYDAQRELEGDKYPTLHLALLWVERLRHHCQQNANDTAQLAAVRQRHAHWLQVKMAKSVTDLHKAATFLWPKFNQLRMLPADQRVNVQQYVKSRLSAAQQPVPEGPGEASQETSASLSAAAPAPAAKKTPRFDEWENVFGVGETESEEDEVDSYVRQRPTMTDDQDLLGWWKTNSSVYPKLAQLARQVLCVPASSSSSERVFSAAGRTIEERRTRLSPSTVDALLFLHDAL